jgi:hypothetical protein
MSSRLARRVLGTMIDVYSVRQTRERESRAREAGRCAERKESRK